MRKKMRINIGSNTTARSINASKYNIAERTKSHPDIDKLYDKRPDGWRRKKIRTKVLGGRE